MHGKHIMKWVVLELASVNTEHHQFVFPSLSLAFTRSLTVRSTNLFFPRSNVLVHHIHHSGWCCVLVFRGGIFLSYLPLIRALFLTLRLNITQSFAIRLFHSLCLFLSNIHLKNIHFACHITVWLYSFVKFRGFLSIYQNVVKIWLNRSTRSMNYAKQKATACNRNDEREIQAGNNDHSSNFNFEQNHSQ